SCMHLSLSVLSPCSLCPFPVPPPAVVPALSLHDALPISKVSHTSLFDHSDLTSLPFLNACFGEYGTFSILSPRVSPFHIVQCGMSLSSSGILSNSTGFISEPFFITKWSLPSCRGIISIYFFINRLHLLPGAFLFY